MSAPPAVPGDLIREAVAIVGADGALQPVNEAMRAWMTAVASTLEQVPLDRDQRDALQQQESVTLSVADSAWDLRLVERDSTRWLFAEDVSQREANLAESLAAARCRWLGATAATLAHDLNNQFNAVLALSATLSYAIEDANDRQTVAELERGTKVGMRMVTSLARLLVRETKHRDLVAPVDLLEDALSMVKKSFNLQSIEVTSEMADDLPKLRVPHIEAVQSLMQGLVALQLAKPGRIACSVRVVDVAVSGGRERLCVVIGCHADAGNAEVVERIKNVVTGHDDKWTAVRNHPDDYESLANSVFLQRRLGGDLRAEVDTGGLRLDYIWPAVR